MWLAESLRDDERLVEEQSSSRSRRSPPFFPPAPLPRPVGVAFVPLHCVTMLTLLSRVPVAFGGLQAGLRAGARQQRAAVRRLSNTAQRLPRRLETVLDLYRYALQSAGDWSTFTRTHARTHARARAHSHAAYSTHPLITPD